VIDRRRSAHLECRAAGDLTDRAGDRMGAVGRGGTRGGRARAIRGDRERRDSRLVAERVVVLVAAVRGIRLRATRHDRRRRRRKHQVIERSGIDGERSRARLPVVDRGDGVGADDRCGADVPAARAVRADRESRGEREVAEGVPPRIESLDGVRLRVPGGDRRRRRADHDVVERSARDLQ
jgi:hypothetical protein